MGQLLALRRLDNPLGYAAVTRNLPDTIALTPHDRVVHAPTSADRRGIAAEARGTGAPPPSTSTFFTAPPWKYASEPPSGENIGS